MAFDNVHGHNQDYVGIMQEATYKVNPIPDFTDVGEPKCNPILTNEDNAPNWTVNKPDDAQSKTLNARGMYSVTDNSSGRRDYTLTMGGFIKNSGFGYVLQCFNQVASFNATDMIYKVEEEGDVCMRNSYHIYVPRDCSPSRTAVILGGWTPMTLTIDLKAQTWVAEFNCATRNEEPTSVQIPAAGDYRDIDTLDKTNYDINFGVLTIGGVNQTQTSALTITYTMNHVDNVGMFSQDGTRNNFLIVSKMVDIDFTLAYNDNKTDTANQSKTFWINASNKTTVSQFGVSAVSDANSSLTVDCYGAMTGEVLDTPGSDLWSFTGKIVVEQDKEDAAKDYTITHKDALGDITANFATP